MFCSKCGVKLVPGESSCRACGQPIEDDQVHEAALRNYSPNANTPKPPSRQLWGGVLLFLGTASLAAVVIATFVGRLAPKTESAPPIVQASSPVLKKPEPTMMEVPNVIGVDEAQARQSINSKFLHPDVTTGTSPIVPAGHVVNQFPGAGNGLPRNATVRIRVSTGPIPGAALPSPRPAPKVEPAPARTEEPPPVRFQQNAPSYNYPLSTSDLDGKSAWELDIMRNTIYAKYGYIFRRSDLQAYFDKQPWYRRNSSFRESWLTPMEKRNVTFIKSYQETH